MRQCGDVDHLGAALVTERLQRFICSHSDDPRDGRNIGISAKNAPAASLEVHAANG